MKDWINKTHCGDALAVLKQLPDNFVDMVMTSPPYWGLRDYGTPHLIWGGAANCKHNFQITTKTGDIRYRVGKNTNIGNFKKPEIYEGTGQGQLCSKCGAWKGELGLEPTVNLYIEHMLLITKEIKRIIKPTGLVFWNHGDCYGGSGQGTQTGYGDHKRKKITGTMKGKLPTLQSRPKCMVMQNYRLIIDMVDKQGWTLRNDIKPIIIWYKPNSMPFSGKDRFGNSYEPIFILTKNTKYFSDLDSVREPHKNEEDYQRHAPFNYRVQEYKKGHQQILGVKSNEEESKKYDRKGIRVPGQSVQGIHRKRHSGYYGANGEYLVNPKGKNPGDVWVITTQPFGKYGGVDHFATFPEELVKRCITFGCPEFVCKKCGKARGKIIDKKLVVDKYRKDIEKVNRVLEAKDERNVFPYARTGVEGHNEFYFTGYTDCKCNAGFNPGIVLDPFAGKGTSCIVAKKMNRSYIGIDIKKEYVNLSERIIHNEAGLL